MKEIQQWSSSLSSFLSWKLFIGSAILWKLPNLFLSDKDPWREEEEQQQQESNWLQKVFCRAVTSFATLWHRHEIHGISDLKHIHGNTLLIGYHSRCTLDILYLFCALRCNVLVTYLFYTVEITRGLLPLLRLIPSKSLDGGSISESFVSALADRPEPLLLLPGGIPECLKQSTERYQIHWKDCPGFARVIHDIPDRLGKNTKVVVFHTRHCEEILWRCDWWYDFSSRWCLYLYDKFKSGNLLIMPPMLVMMLYSVGFIFLPKPIKLDTYFGSPLVLQEGESAENFATRVKLALQELIDHVETLDDPPSRPWLERLSLVPYGAFTLIQNSFFYGVTTALIVGTYPSVILYTLYRLVVK
eukprot:gene3885-4244_t